MAVNIEVRLEDANTGALSWKAAAKGARWKQARDLPKVIREADKELGVPTPEVPREIDYVE